jgi:hypothetical protein
MNEIASITDFATLLISWREPYIERGNRQRYVVAKLTRNGDDADLEYLVGTEDFEKATQKGFEGFGRYPISVKRYTKVMDYLSYRLPPKKRADFESFMKSIGLDVSLKDQISYFQLLGYSGGKLPDDSFNFHIDYTNIPLPIQMCTELTGIVYQNNWKSNFETLAIGDQIVLGRDLHNSSDPFAIEACWKNQRIGYIDRVQSKSFTTWISEDRPVSAYIYRKNGTPEWPRLYLFIDIR